MNESQNLIFFRAAVTADRPRKEKIWWRLVLREKPIIRRSKAE